jgi:hypothetical protein
MSYTELISTIPDLFDVSDSIKVVEVAKKYDQPSVSGVPFCLLTYAQPNGVGQTRGYPSILRPASLRSITAAKVSTAPLSRAESPS